VPLSTKVGLGPGHTVLDGDPAFPLPQKGALPPNFQSISIVAKRSPISATAEHWYDRSLALKNVCVQLKYPFVRMCAFCVF